MVGLRSRRVTRGQAKLGKDICRDGLPNVSMLELPLQVDFGMIGDRSEEIHHGDDGSPTDHPVRIFEQVHQLGDEASKLHSMC